MIIFAGRIEKLADWGQDMEQLPATLQFLPPDKLREQDSVLRMMCVEILLLLSTCRITLSLSSVASEYS